MVINERLLRKLVVDKDEKLALMPKKSLYGLTYAGYLSSEFLNAKLVITSFTRNVTDIGFLLQQENSRNKNWWRSRCPILADAVLWISRAHILETPAPIVSKQPASSSDDSYETAGCTQGHKDHINFFNTVLNLPPSERILHKVYFWYSNLKSSTAGISLQQDADFWDGWWRRRDTDRVHHHTGAYHGSKTYWIEASGSSMCGVFPSAALQHESSMTPSQWVSLNRR